jgi:hypothetical protein
MNFPLVIQRMDGGWTRLTSHLHVFRGRFSDLAQYGARRIMSEETFQILFPNEIISDTFEIKWY